MTKKSKVFSEELGEIATKIEYNNGTVAWLGEPVLMGTIPVRTELQILCAGPPLEIDFPIYEYMGTRLFKVVDGAPVEQPLLQYDDIQPGDEVFGWIQGIVSDDRKFVKAGEYTFGMIAFDEDDRHCWVMGGVAYTKGLMRLEMYRG